MKQNRRLWDSSINDENVVNAINKIPLGELKYSLFNNCQTFVDKVWRDARSPENAGTNGGTRRPAPYPGQAAGSAGRGVFDPLVFDLDGDGVELVSIDQSTAQFDLNADGFREQTGWVKADDGMLALDANGDGKINNITELFGDALTDGFDELATLDSNNDKVINSSDAQFTNLRVWQDLDQDGITDTGELKSLAQLNIRSISLTTTETSVSNEGNLIRTTGKYTRTDNTQRDVVALWFAADRLNTTYDQPYQLKPETLFLPTTRGYGKLPDLYISMSLDSQLLGLMREFAQLKLQNLSQVIPKIEAILFRWAKVEAVAPDSRGQFFDARKLGFLESFLGQPINVTFVNAQQTIFLQQSWDVVVQNIAARLTVQGAMSDVFANTTYLLNTDMLTTSESLSALLTRLVSAQPTNMADVARYWSYAITALDNHAGQFGLAEDTYNSQIRTALTSSGLTNHLDALRNPTFGLELNESLYATQNTGNFFEGLAGNDTFYGSSSNDIFNGDDGNDVIDSTSGGDWVDGGAGIDTINNADFSSATNNLTITNAGNQVITLSSGARIANIEKYSNLTTGSGSDRISFSGREGSSINTGSGNDTINAGLGVFDFVDGGTGVDSLTINYALGDTGQGMVTNVYSASQISVFRYISGTNNNLLDSIDIRNVERFNITGTSKGDSITTVGGNDVINSGAGDDYIDSGVGNDTVNAGDGNDTVVANPGNIVDGGSGNDEFRLNLSSQTTALSIVNYRTAGINLPGIVTARNFELFNLTTGGGDDSVTQLGVVDSIVIRGSDTITTGSGNDTINAGLGVFDFVDGGTGVDSLTINYALGDTGQGMVTNVYSASQISVFRYISGTNSTFLDSIDIRNVERFNITGTSKGDSITTVGGNDVIDSGAGDDYIDSGAGNDTVNAGDGNDTVVANPGNIVDAGSGNDELRLNLSSQTTALSIVNYRTAGINLPGIVTARNFELFNLTTGGGDDSVTQLGVVDGIVIRGRDTITTGSGNDTINAGLGVFDFVDGGTGVDSLTINYALGDTGQGMVTNIYSASQISVFRYTSGTNNTFLDSIDIRNVERFNITGTSKGDSITTVGGNDVINSGAGDDYIDSGAGNDIINGGAGADNLTGGTGNDTYIIDNLGDIINETSTLATEIDTVQSSITHTLGTNLENLTLLGTTAINGTGNTANNILTGNTANNILNGLAGNDTLTGLAGNDTLTGGLGSDRFLFDSKRAFALADLGVDTITDFLRGTDKIVLDKTTFTALTSVSGSALSTSEFATINSATNGATLAGSSAARIVFNSANGQLFYNSNGTTAGLGTGGQFATLSGISALANTDLLVQA